MRKVNFTMHYFAFVLLLGCAGAACAQEPCTTEQPTAVFTIHHAAGHPDLSTNPSDPIWQKAASASLSRDCSRKIDYPKIKTTIRGFWTDTDLYLLFQCPYSELNLWLPADNSQARVKLWDRDVVEMFLGSDWKNIRQYREFEIAPTGDWIDLNIDLDKDSYDHAWRSGWTTKARIDEASKTWYAAARIPLSAVTGEPVINGTKWRANLYRIDGLGEDPQRRFMCWQPTCVQNRDPNHVPEHFGAIVFQGE